MKNKFKIYYVILIIVNLIISHAAAYEVDTHARMSRAAFESSMLRYNGDEILRLYGLEVDDKFENSQGVQQSILV